jgi:hypothetical protein
MIRLDLGREPYWLDLVPGVRVHVRPCTTALIMAARAKLIDADSDAGARTAVLLRELAILAIEAWEGIGDDAGEAVPVSPEAITAIMDIWPVAEAFERLYLGPAMVLDDEKNG